MLVGGPQLGERELLADGEGPLGEAGGVAEAALTFGEQVGARAVGEQGARR